MDAFSALGGVFQGLSNLRSSGSSKKKDKVNNLGDTDNVSGNKTASVYSTNDTPAKKSRGIAGYFGFGSKSSTGSTGSIASTPDSNSASVYSTNNTPATKSRGFKSFFGKDGKDGKSDLPTVNEGGLGGSKISASQMLSGGMPCKFELLMEFFCCFFFTFIIYFIVFAFVPYDGFITKILEFIRDVTKKFTDFLYTLIPEPVKKAASRLFPKFIVKFFKETLPKLLSKKSEELTTPLKKKLQKIKDDIDKKINSEKKKLGKNKDFISEMTLYYNEQYLLIMGKLTALWEKFKDKIVPALIMSFIYYVIWFTFFKLIPTILKYLINVAQQFKQP